MGNVNEVNDANFQAEVLEAAEPVLVDFWAPWCGPCRAIAPMVNELASENAGAVKIVKVNVDESPMIAGQYQIHSIPTLMVFKGGNMVEMLVGVQPKHKVQNALDQAIG
ncbi:MAG: thioredoxin [Planctomycetaceae bacterium]|nr:thioredoxin [Planctomycetaceae bacterium]